MNTNMGKKDLAIMSCLRENARETLTRISRRTAVPISTVYERLKQYEQRFVKKHTTLVDFAKLGFHTRANVLVKVGKEGRAAFMDSLLKSPNVNSVFKVNNGFDFMFEVVFRSIAELENYLERMDEKFPVEQRVVYYIIDDIRREAFLSNPDSVFLVYRD